jgi:hypothetical protein
MKKRKKARVSQTRVRRKPKPVVKRRKPVAKKKSSTTWDEPEDQDVEEDTEADADVTADKGEEEPPPPVPTETAASDDGVYRVDSAEISIKGQLYHKGDTVSLTPEELETVQAMGVRILPVE